MRQSLASCRQEICYAIAQDTARSFAATYDEKEKFQLYMQATHFDEAAAHLTLAENHVGAMRDILLRQSEHVKVILTP